MSDYEFPNTFVYPHRVGEFGEPLPFHETSFWDWTCCIIGRFKDDREFSLSLVHRLVSRYWHLRAPVIVRPYGSDFIFFCGTEEDVIQLYMRGWVHFKGSFMVLQRLRGHSVLDNLNLRLLDMWVTVEGLPIQHSTPMVAESVLARVGNITDREELQGQFPIPRPRVKLLVDLSVPTVPGCYFPTYGNRATWVRFKYEGILRFCKKCGFVGHGWMFRYTQIRFKVFVQLRMFGLRSYGLVVILMIIILMIQGNHIRRIRSFVWMILVIPLHLHGILLVLYRVYFLIPNLVGFVGWKMKYGGESKVFSEQNSRNLKFLCHVVNSLVCLIGLPFPMLKVIKAPGKIILILHDRFSVITWVNLIP